MRTAGVVLVVALTAGGVVAAPAVAVAGTGTPAALVFAEDVVVSGSPAHATLTLTAPATDPTVVALASTNPAVVPVPATVTVPAGATQLGLTLDTVAFTGPGDFACVNATAAGVTVTDCVNVNPAPPGGPAIQSVTFAPNPVVGGGFGTGTVRFATAPDGAEVTLTSSNPAVVSVPADTVVPGGSATGAFPVTTAPVTAPTTVTVTATAPALGTTATGTITVTPGTPPAADTVRITKAKWKARLLEITATSTNPNAILSVFLTSSGGFMFTLTNNGNGRYSDRRGWVFDPLNITVRSNFGGSASAQTTH